MYRNLFETHFTERNGYFYDHYRRHVAADYNQYFRETEDSLFEPMTEDEYDEYAHQLSQQPVYSSDYDDAHNVIGFVTTDNRIVKFGKQLSEVVVYRADRWNPHTITYYKVAHARQRERYNSLMRDYFREILPEDDYYNA